MSHRQTEHLRVLIANERKDRLELVVPIVAALGHEVIAREIEVEDVGAVTARERPDVAFVGLGESSEHALQMVEKIVHEAACPVIALIHARDPEFVKEASKRGVFAYINDADTEDWQSSIDIVLRRFTEYHDLEGAFGRRAVTERAKGILMERHSIDEPAAFELLREQARSTNRKVIDIATAVVDGHRLLPKQPARTASYEVLSPFAAPPADPVSGLTIPYRPVALVGTVAIQPRIYSSPDHLKQRSGFVPDTLVVRITPGNRGNGTKRGTLEPLRKK